MYRRPSALRSPQRASLPRLIPHPLLARYAGSLADALTPDNIESNIVNVAANTSSAAEELTSAHEYQRKAGRRMACLLIILGIVALFILLAILS